MKIARLETIPYRAPMWGALQWGKHGKLEAAAHVLVRVHLEDGSYGEAEAPPRPSIYGETTASVRGIVAHLGPRLVGLDIQDHAGIAEGLASVANNHTAKGALDMACWDARAKTKGRTLFETLRGPQPKVRVSYILGISDEKTMLEEARRVHQAGVRTLKVKVGRDYDHDLRVIAALHQEFGTSMKLYADSNETLQPHNAANALSAMKQAGIAYVEEPLPVRGIKERARLRALEILPIIADDSCFALADLERELDFDTFDILNIKTARTGFGESLAMLEMARAAGKGVMVGSQASTTLGTLHAALMASQAGVNVENELSFWLKLKDDITNQPLRLQDGWLSLDELQHVHVSAAKLEALRER